MANLGTQQDNCSDDSDLFIEPPPSFVASHCRSGVEGRIAGMQGQPSLEKATNPIPCPRDEVMETKTPAKHIKQSKKYSNAEQEARKTEQQKQRIQDAVNSFKLSHQNCDDRLEVIVSRQVYDEKDKGILRELREILRPEQITCDDRSMANLISWRLKHVHSSSLPTLVPVSLLVLKAADYVDHMHKKTLHNLCQGLKRELPGQKVMLVVCGVDNYCRRTARKAFKDNYAQTALEEIEGRDSIRYGKAAVQDSYTLLFLEYGIRTHDIQNDEELHHFICDISHAVAKTPHYRNQAYLESFLTYKRKKAMKSTGPLLYQRNNKSSNMFHDDSDDPDVPDKRMSGVSGEELRAAYLQMLVHIPGISADMARAIQGKYPTLRTLLKELQNSETDVRVLSEIQYGRSKRRIGVKQSQTIVEILTSLDPNIEC